MPDRYAVIGNPIAHSKSPIIHQAFAKQTGQDIEYERVLAPLDGFNDTVRQLQAAGYKGANVTVPFKFEAFALSIPTPRASNANAVNTLVFREQEIRGDNTDGLGLVTDIKANLKVEIHGKRILLIGAGGAAEGVLHPLLEQKPEKLVIANRTMDKALRMTSRVEQFSNFSLTSIKSAAFEELNDKKFDIVINATSSGLNDAQLPLPPGLFANEALAYDMMYGKETPFMQFAKANGATVIADGLGMLVEQAAEAFYIWRNVRPATAPVMALIRSI